MIKMKNVKIEMLKMYDDFDEQYYINELYQKCVRENVSLSLNKFEKMFLFVFDTNIMRKNTIRQIERMMKNV